MATQGENSPVRLPQRSLLADGVYDIIRENLISGVIVPGSRLNLDSLSREMHVSNTPVRQALARLESEGLVTKEAYRGFTASQLLDSRAIAQLYEYRLILEPPTAARAAQLGSGSKARTLEDLCDRTEIDRLFEGSELEEMAKRDTDFHCTIADLCDNSVISENVRHTLTRMNYYSAYKKNGAWSRTWEEHRRIAKAISEGDAQTAAKNMRAHLKSAYERSTRATARKSSDDETADELLA